MNWQKLTQIIAIVAPLTACNYFLSGQPTDRVKGDTRPVPVTEFFESSNQADLSVNEVELLLAQGLVYDGVIQNSFQNYCVECHSSKVASSPKPSLDSYDSLLLGKDLIVDVLKLEKMPPRGGMSAIRRKLLIQWLELGLPQGEGKPPVTPGETSEAEESIFSTVMSKVLQPRCLICHGEGSDFDFRTEDSAKKHSAEIRQAVISKKMPVGKNKLTQEEIDLIVRWTNAVESTASDKEPPIADESADTVKFDLIYEKVLQPRCIVCHVAGDDYDFTTLSSTRKHADAIKDAVIKRRMPKGKYKLTEDQIELTTKWVDQGAQ